MAYATTADLDAIWGRDSIDLLTVDRLTQQRDPVKVAAALDGASAAMNGYLARRYPLPLLPTGQGMVQLKELCADLAVYRLATSGGQMLDIIEKRNKAAVDFLRDVAAAKAEIDLVPQTTGRVSAPPSSPATKPC